MIVKQQLTTERYGVHDITADVLAAIAKSGVKNGTVTVQVPHSTAGIAAGVFCDGDVALDIMNETRRIVPARITYRHETSADDAAGHIKAALFGNSATTILLEGRPVGGDHLGWYLLEYDGPRERTFYIAVMADGGEVQA